MIENQSPACNSAAAADPLDARSLPISEELRKERMVRPSDMQIGVDTAEESPTAADRRGHTESSNVADGGDECEEAVCATHQPVVSLTITQRPPVFCSCRVFMLLALRLSAS